MWVFGYGSLMWDGWEKKHGCLRRVPAQLLGYTRAFNKASVRNWGTKANPAPTLNVVAQDGAVCHGIAFEFAEQRNDAVMTELEDREGGFELSPRPVSVDDGAVVDAIVPVYAGKNIINKTVAETAQLILVARGTSGSCSDYVKGVAQHMRASGVDDPVVAELVAEIAKLRRA
jgi:glutathione-specific gamma-glutamylcyclotransferase